MVCACRLFAKFEDVSHASQPGKVFAVKLKIILAALCVLLGWQAGAQTYNWTTIAGLANTPAYADGTNNAAFFNNPQGVAVDGAGNIFTADANNYVI